MTNTPTPAQARPDDPAWLDTLLFAGASWADIQALASAKRPGICWHEHPWSHVRMRVQMAPGASASPRPTLVLLPDGPASIESYDALLAALGTEFNLVLIEIPGFGYSHPRDPRALEFEALCAITAEAFASLALGPAVWVGPCVQGLVALGVARARPELVRALVVLQTGDWATECHWGGAVLDPKGLLRRPHVGQVGFRLAREAMAVDWWARYAAGPGLDLPAVQQEARQLMRSHCCYALASLSQKWFGREQEPDLQVSGMPATVVWGLADASHRTTDAAQRRSVLRYLPQACYVELPGVGHFADLEAVPALRQEVLALLGPPPPA
jgi:pimeloyl-ACP methyl ester carboxylesterase